MQHQTTTRICILTASWLAVYVSELLHVQVDDEGIDSRRLVEERQKLLNDIERLRAENDSLKVFNMCTCTLHVCVCAPCELLV